MKKRCIKSVFMVFNLLKGGGGQLLAVYKSKNKAAGKAR
jgi:hypothetical protein